jgi:hypothetical protein
MFTCSFYRFTQAALELAGREEMAPPFSVQPNIREAFHRLGVQDVTEFDSD